MDTKTIIILAIAAVVLFAVLGMVLAGRKKSEQHHGQLKDEFDLTVKTMGGEREALAELDCAIERAEGKGLPELNGQLS
jgi:hypothetical protein